MMLFHPAGLHETHSKQLMCHDVQHYLLLPNDPFSEVFGVVKAAHKVCFLDAVQVTENQTAEELERLVDIG